MGNRQIEPLTFTFLAKRVTISLIFMHKIYLFNAVLESLNCHLWLCLELVAVKHLNAWVIGVHSFGSAERNVEERALSLLKDLTPDFLSSRWKAFQTAKPLMRVVPWKDCRHNSEDWGSNLFALSEYPGDPGQALPWASDNSLSYLLNWNPFIIPQITSLCQILIFGRSTGGFWHSEEAMLKVWLQGACLLVGWVRW